jgi:hypothetical protein
MLNSLNELKETVRREGIYISVLLIISRIKIYRMEKGEILAK